jgi:hypothetical protein
MELGSLRPKLQQDLSGLFSGPDMDITVMGHDHMLGAFR